MAEQSTQQLMLEIMEKNRLITLTDSVEETQSKIADAAKNSVAVKDSYGNSLLSIGTDDKVESFTNYGLSNDTLNWTLWLALYNDSWVFRRAIDKPAQDEIRAGITLVSTQGTDFTQVYKDLQRYRSDFIQLLQWGALFGGSIACLMFDNMKDEEYAQPMRIEQIRQAKTLRMYVVDRWYGVAPSDGTVTNMASLDFGKPKYYDVTLADGHTVRFHHDFVLRYEHRTAPKLIKNGMLQGWGYAEGSHILNELTRDDKLKASIQSLVDKALIEVIKMDGMRGVFMGADQDNENQLRKRLEMVNWARTYNSLTFLDSNDDYQEHGFSGLSGLADILQNNMWLISSALEMQGVLFGDLKGGFSQDEEALERYDETINNRCENFLRPVYTKFLRLLYAIHNIDEGVEFTFNSLVMKKHDDELMEATFKFVDLAQKLLDSGVIDTSEFAKALQLYTTKNVVDFGLTDEKIDKLKENMSEELEGIDLSGDVNERS